MQTIETKPICNYRDYGRMGGLQTLMRYGKEHFVALGKMGGRPKLRQLPVPGVLIQENGGRLPNSLKGLKELWKQHREELLTVSSSSQGG